MRADDDSASAPTPEELERNSSLEVNEIPETEARAAEAEAGWAIFGDTDDRVGEKDDDEGRVDFRFADFCTAVAPVAMPVALRAERINLASANASACGEGGDDLFENDNFFEESCVNGDDGTAAADEAEGAGVDNSVVSAGPSRLEKVEKEKPRGDTDDDDDDDDDDDCG